MSEASVEYCGSLGCTVAHRTFTADPSMSVQDIVMPDLRAAIGPSKGRVTLEQHMQRLAFTLNHIPAELWPSTADLRDKFIGRTAAIVGGGPSLAETYSDLRCQVSNENAVVFALNKSHDWLINGQRRGRKHWDRMPMVPDFGVLADPSPHVANYMTPHPKVTYLLATELDYRAQIRFLQANSRAYLWIPTYEGDASDVRAAGEMFPNRDMHFISGGSTVGLRTINLAVAMGFSTIDLYGFDSCYAPKTSSLYAYDKEYVTTDLADSVAVSKRTGDRFRFRSNHHMAKQAIEFELISHHMNNLIVDGDIRGVKIRVHGDGLIPWMAWKDGGTDSPICHATPHRMKAKYGEHSFWNYAEDKPMADA